ncbi:HD domain-containing protein [Kitasatospora sp. NPDC085879]|uniref:HD domain-containing protein n=1 Tax=Kitasatospora sp. NPDC085879 TaxID=3154769 RepID=UPI0034339FFB
MSSAARPYKAGAVDVLAIALDDCREPALRPLPAEAAELLAALGAPPRLVAHLRAVHEVAGQLVDWLAARCPGLELDREAVLFGAATHDIGKVRHPAELSGPGSEHEAAGQELLLAHGVSERLARFAAGHADWEAPGTRIEDLLVSLADKAWKNRRVPGLEDLVVAELCAAAGRPAWEEFLALDEILTGIGDGAEARLAYQAAHPLGG